MAGTFKSGRKRIRARVEETRRLLALDYAREHGGDLVTCHAPNGTFLRGTCPICRQPVRYLYERPDACPACRRCARLAYRSQSQSNSIAGAVKCEDVAPAMALLKTSVSTGDGQQFNEAMRTLNATQNLAALPPAPKDADEIFAEIQARIVADDLTATTEIMEFIRREIMRGEENFTNRRGESSRIPMRPDALNKLVNAYATLSNIRANRAGIATNIVESRKASGSHPTNLQELLLEDMKARGHRSPSGYTLEELEAAEHGEQK